jgi:hypothetical protein
MPNKNFKAWIAALRSGDYKQTTGYLHITAPINDSPNNDNYRPVGFCCLGVACDLFDPTQWVEREADTGEGAYESFHENGYSLEPVVRDWLGLGIEPWGEEPDEYGHVSSAEWQEKIQEMNDEGSTFTEIADALEERFGSKN